MAITFYLDVRLRPISTQNDRLDELFLTMAIGNFLVEQKKLECLKCAKMKVKI